MVGHGRGRGRGSAPGRSGGRGGDRTARSPSRGSSPRRRSGTPFKTRAPSAEQTLRNERRDKGLCFLCGKSGHHARDCPDAKRSENERGAQK